MSWTWVRAAGAALLLASACFADTITMKSGRVLSGTYLGGTARQVRLDTGEQVQTVDVSEIVRIEFSIPVAVAPPPPPPPPLPPPPPEPAPAPVEERRRLDPPAMLRPEPQPAPYASGEIPAGANIVVRMIDGVDSETARVGQTFAASLDEPVMVGGSTLIPRGADAVVRLVDAKESGKLTGRAELTLSLSAVRVDGRMVDINSQSVSRESGSRGARTAKVAGGTAAVGAIIGAIAGGGSGAAIGAVAGGAAGAGSQTVMKGQQVRVPSETRLTFTLDTAVRL